MTKDELFAFLVALKTDKAALTAASVTIEASMIEPLNKMLTKRRFTDPIAIPSPYILPPCF